MNSDEIIAEMQRKPDAQVLLEWVAEFTTDGLVCNAIEAYFEAQEED